MPAPCFLDIPSPFTDGARPIGIMAISPVDGKEKTFIWWRNFTGASLAKEEGRKELARFVTRLIIDTKAEITVGPAINLEKSDVRTKKVSLFKGWPNVFGLYIEIPKRPWFNFKLTIGGLPLEREMKGLSYADDRGNSIPFGELLEKVKSSLPRPVEK